MLHIGNPPESGELSRWTTTSIVFVDMAATVALAQAFTSKTSCDKRPRGGQKARVLAQSWVVIWDFDNFQMLERKCGRSDCYRDCATFYRETEKISQTKVRLG
jgi:hypothetical protein